MEYDYLYSKISNKMGHSFIREILKLTKGVEGLISFAGGLPNPEAFPVNELSKLSCKVIEEEGTEILQYGLSEGDTVLKKAIIKFEKLGDYSLDEILITVGSTNAIYYYTKSLIDEGDVIICEAPTFTGSISSMEACGAEIIGVEMDDCGVIPEKLEETILNIQNKGKKIKYIYLIPEFQNPSGRSMNIDRRRKILDIAIKFNLPILEDQPYRELRYDGEKEKTLWEIARDEYNNPDIVTLVKSFSKILGPGMRLGYALGNKKLISTMVKWAQKINVSPDCISQRVAARYIEQGYLSQHINEIKKLYKPRRDLMIESLKKYMPESFKWTIPEGGMFIWITCPASIDTTKLFEKAVENKIAFIPGENFYPQDMVRKNEFRLNFSYPTMDEIEEGIKRLGNLLEKSL